MARRTCSCGRSLADPGPGGGRPRTKCEVCKPPRRKPGSGPGRPQRDQPTPVEVVLLDAPARNSTGPGPAAGVLLPESVYAATLSQLAAAGREHTAAGMAALALARQLDANVATAPSVSNAMLKALDAALAGAKPAEDALDDLARRRAAKAASA